MLLLLLLSEAAEVPRAQGAVVGVGVVFARGAVVAACAPPVAAGEDVLNTLIGGQLTRLTRPGGGEGAAVEVLNVGCIARFGDAWDSCGASVS